MRSPTVMVQTTRGRRIVAEEGKLGIYEMSRGIKAEDWGYLHSICSILQCSLVASAGMLSFMEMARSMHLM